MTQTCPECSEKVEAVDTPMIDTLLIPAYKCHSFPQKPGGVITCVYCDFSGGSIYDRPDQPNSVTIRACFRYVNNLKNPTKGVCGKYECREKLEMVVTKEKGVKNMGYRDRRSSDRGDRTMHKAKCADCGEDCEVPFQPTEGRPVYCRECYQKHRPPRRY